MSEISMRDRLAMHILTAIVPKDEIDRIWDTNATARFLAYEATDAILRELRQPPIEMLDGASARYNDLNPFMCEAAHKDALSAAFTAAIDAIKGEGK